MQNASSRLRDALKKYHSEVEEAYDYLSQNPIADTNELKAQGVHLLQQGSAFCFHTVLRTISTSPTLDTLLYRPGQFTWMAPNPDFNYSWAFLDGRRRWRIRGVRGHSVMAAIQSLSGYYSDTSHLFLGNYELDDFELAEDGSFEATASSTPEPGNWIRLDANSTNNWINFREGFHDWEQAKPTRLSIVPLDPDPAPANPGVDAVSARLEGSARLLKFCLQEFSGGRIRQLVDDHGWNTFVRRIIDPKDGGSPAAGYTSGVFRLADDEVLLLDLEAPSAKYWGIQLADIWQQTAEYVDHQSSLNAAQARVDDDGRVRFVVAIRDPGAPNWLDTVGQRSGYILARWFFGTGDSAPRATVVKADDVFAHLPSGTPRITPGERRARIEARQRGIARRYGE